MINKIFVESNDKQALNGFYSLFFQDKDTVFAFGLEEEENEISFKYYITQIASVANNNVDKASKAKGVYFIGGYLGVAVSILKNKNNMRVFEMDILLKVLKNLIEQEYAGCPIIYIEDIKEKKINRLYSYLCKNWNLPFIKIQSKDIDLQKKDILKLIKDYYAV